MTKSSSATGITAGHGVMHTKTMSPKCTVSSLVFDVGLLCYRVPLILILSSKIFPVVEFAFVVDGYVVQRLQRLLRVEYFPSLNLFLLFIFAQSEY